LHVKKAAKDQKLGIYASGLQTGLAQVALDRLSKLQPLLAERGFFVATVATTFRIVAPRACARNVVARALPGLLLSRP